MDREQMRMAILKQERTFRQQVHELHRVYHVQKELMREMQMAGLNRDQAIVEDVDTKPKLKLLSNERATNHQQFYSFPNSKAPTPSPADECNLELTLATGSNSRSQKGKQVKSSNSDSGTVVSSTSTDSELAQFKEFDVTTVRFESESRRLADEMNQSPWLHQCLSLRMA